MAAQVYREGDTHEVRGITCEVKNISANDVGAYLDNGWVKDPTEIGKEVEAVEETVKPVKVTKKSKKK